MCDVNKKLLIVLLLQIVFIAVFYTFGFLFLLLWVCIPFTLSSHQLLGHFRHSSNISLNFWDFLSTNPTSQFFFCFFFILRERSELSLLQKDASKENGIFIFIQKV